MFNPPRNAISRPHRLDVTQHIQLTNRLVRVSGTFGFTVYFIYGLRNSSEEYRMKGLKPPEQTEDNTEDLKLSKFDRNKNSKFLDDF